mmetsp:Transcript_127632/g.357386  ORF Transcript_127632/g.357386 Transcript_127632/m.357386 type:complete len:211 (-) Transcript_127632:551-1183(-)
MFALMVFWLFCSLEALLFNISKDCPAFSLELTRRSLVSFTFFISFLAFSLALFSFLFSFCKKPINLALSSSFVFCAAACLAGSCAANFNSVSSFCFRSSVSSLAELTRSWASSKRSSKRVFASCNCPSSSSRRCSYFLYSLFAPYSISATSASKRCWNSRSSASFCLLAAYLAFSSRAFSTTFKAFIFAIIARPHFWTVNTAVLRAFALP